MAVLTNPITIMALDLAAAPIEAREAMIDDYKRQIEVLVREQAPELHDDDVRQRLHVIQMAVAQETLAILTRSSGQIGRA